MVDQTGLNGTFDFTVEYAPEINAESIVTAALSRLSRDGKFDAGKAKAAFAELGVDTEKIDPARA